MIIATPTVCRACAEVNTYSQPGTILQSSYYHSHYTDQENKGYEGCHTKRRPKVRVFELGPAGIPPRCANSEAQSAWRGEPVSLLAPPSLPVFPLPPPRAPHSCLFPLAGSLAPEAQFVVTIGNVRGILDTSVLDPEQGPQGPFITYSYYVTYNFVEDEEDEGNIYEGVLAEVCASPSGWSWGCGAGGSLAGRTAS